jgi:hypothetical protein
MSATVKYKAGFTPADKHTDLSDKHTDLGGQRYRSRGQRYRCINLTLPDSGFLSRLRLAKSLGNLTRLDIASGVAAARRWLSLRLFFISLREGREDDHHPLQV